MQPADSAQASILQPPASSLQPRNLWFVAGHLYRHRQLIWRLTVREVQARYRGSWLGPVWSLLTPLLMLAVYLFVFTVVFQPRWSAGPSLSRLDFALAAFAGMTLFQLFAETVTSAPGLILSNVSYVKRVVFPLEILPITKFLAALVNTGFALAVFLAAVAIGRGTLAPTVLLVPLVVLPWCLICLGAAYFLSSLGVFLRDLSHVIGLAVTVLMYLSPVFYPLSNLPVTWQGWLGLNPLAVLLEDFRRVTLDGTAPDWTPWLVVTAAAALFAAAGWAWFMRSKRAFADVL